MSHDTKTLEWAYDRTEGKCHLCRKNLAFKNYGKAGQRGAWEIEHSIPRSKGGTDHRNNLYAACIDCNRDKSNSTTRTARLKNGFSCAPHSKKHRTENAWAGGTIASLAALILIPPPVRIGAVILSAVVGAVVGYKTEAK